MNKSLLNSFEIEFKKNSVDSNSVSYLSWIITTKNPVFVVVENTFLKEDIKDLKLMNYRSNEIEEIENKKEFLDLILMRTLESYHNSTMYVICSRLKEHSVVLKQIASSKEIGNCSIKFRKSNDIDISIQICNEKFSFKLPPHTPDSVSVGIVSVLINLLKKEK